MEPTPTELESFTELTPIMDWAGVAGDPADAASRPSTVRGGALAVPLGELSGRLELARRSDG
eukprot:1390429-Amphidinium_carterae.1